MDAPREAKGKHLVLVVRIPCVHAAREAYMVGINTYYLVYTGYTRYFCIQSKLQPSFWFTAGNLMLNYLKH